MSVSSAAVVETRVTGRYGTDSVPKTVEVSSLKEEEEEEVVVFSVVVE